MKLDTIHKDRRGSICLVTGDLKQFQEVTIFTTNNGFARGGCIHKKSDEFATVIEGAVRYRIGSRDSILVCGQSLTIPKNTPHYFVSLVDSVVMEWGATPEEKTEKHLATRKIVDEINSSN